LEISGATKDGIQCKFDTGSLKTSVDISSGMKIKIHPEGKIDAKPVISFERIIQRIDSNRDNFLPENRDLLKRFIYDARLGKTILGREKKKVGLKRLLKYIQDLKKLDVYFKRPFGNLTETDIERFILDLEDGLIKTVDGRPFALETQVVIKKMIKKFYKWLEGDNIEVPRKVRWIDTSYELPDYVALTKAEVDKILVLHTSNSTFNLLRNRALLMFMFDSGIRAEEVLNVRMRHLSMKNDNYVVRVEFSKTKKRTITLPFCKTYLDQWLDVHPAVTEASAQLFPITYNALLHLVHRFGEIVNKKISPHSLRHSSATYWCQHLTPYELCYRFGWSMSSKMPQRYIDREGLNQEKANKVVRAAKVETLEQENSILSQRLAALEDQMTKFFEKDVKEAKKIIRIVSE